MASLWVSLVAWPMRLRKSMPISNSSSVNCTSRAKAWACLTSAAMISRSRSFGAAAMASRTAPVTLASLSMINGRLLVSRWPVCFCLARLRGSNPWLDCYAIVCMKSSGKRSQGPSDAHLSRRAKPGNEHHGFGRTCYANDCTTPDLVIARIQQRGSAMTDTTLDGISSTGVRNGTASTGPALRLHGKADGVEALAPSVEPVAIPVPAPGQCLVEVKASGVNMSDVKAALGHMPYAIWPRTPGRDYAGVVLEGPAHLVGQRGLGQLGRARHPPRRHPHQISGGLRRRDLREALDHHARRGRRHRRAVHHRL